MINRLKKLISKRNFVAIMLFSVLVFNYGIITKITAANSCVGFGTGFIPTAGMANFCDCVPKEQNVQTNASMLSGMCGSIIQTGNGFGSGTAYSAEVNTAAAIFERGDPQEIYAYKQELNSRPSAINFVAQANDTLLDQKPASGVDFIQQKVFALTNPGKVYAQSDTAKQFYSPGGTGYDLLKPVQNFWSWSVRVVYGFLIILVIILAFAIMFRQKLSGGVEVTIQNAIPSIALAMILVPLSYAISGAFIDVITVGTNAVHEFLIGTANSPGYSIFQQSSDPEKLADHLTGGTYDDRGYFPDDPRVDWLRARDRLNVAPAFSNAAQGVNRATGIGSFIIFQAIGSIVNLLTGQTSREASDLSWLGDVIQFIIALVTIWIGIQIFVKLFGKYLTLILLPIISPFVFATVAIPGNGSKSIVWYCKSLLSASLFYIVTYLMFLLMMIFTDEGFQASIPSLSSGAFNPPLIGLRSIGFGSSEITQLILTLIGLGIYFSIPKTLDGIDDALGTKLIIPQLLKTPFESFKDSYKTTFKTAPTAVFGAGAASIRGIRGGAKGIADARAMPGRLSTNARKVAMNFSNYRKGIDENHTESAQNREAARISTEISNKERERALAVQSGNGGKARALAKEIEGLRKQADNLGVANKLSSAVKAEDVAGLKVTLQSKRGDTAGFVNFTVKALDDLYDSISGGGNPLTPAIVGPAASATQIRIPIDFILESTKITLPTKVDVAVGYSTFVPGSSQELDWGGPAPVDEQFAYALTAGAEAHVFGKASVVPDFIKLIADNSNPTAYANAFTSDSAVGKKITIPLVLLVGRPGPNKAPNIADFTTLFGLKRGDTYVGGMISNVGTRFKFGDLGAGIPNKRIFKVLDKDSNALTLVVTKNG